MSFAAKLKSLVETVEEQNAYILRMKTKDEQYRDNLRLLYSALVKGRVIHENDRTVVEDGEFPMISNEDLVVKDVPTLFSTVGQAFGCVMENLSTTRKEIMAMSRELDASYDKVMSDWDRVRSGGKSSTIAETFRNTARPSTPENKRQPAPLATPPASSGKPTPTQIAAETTNKDKQTGKKSSDQPKTPTTTLEREQSKRKK